MRLLKEDTHIDFLGKRKIAAIISGVLIVLGLFSIVYHQGLNYGIDFKGGFQVRILFEKVVDLDELRGQFDRPGMGSVSLQTIGDGNEVKLVLPLTNSLGSGAELTENLKKLLAKNYPKLEVRSIESVGPQVGDELKKSALYAILISLGLILVYISLRFHWKFGISAILTLAHDICIVVGFFSMFNMEFSLPVIAALLTVVGYSLNDTIVVFDRIRENMARFRKKTLGDIINLSINETLTRTLLTSGTTLFVVLALFFLGGDIIHDFSFGILMGILVGTYSSIYVASPLLLIMSVQTPLLKQQQSKNV
ncbi:MAG: protein translocase subunit SecF [SAR324 cluster bacterium]|nr:protein translocase subunit SecF [SAR324 cluster bacterium]